MLLNPLDAREALVVKSSEHQRITNAGWAYRTNERGWVIYKDPQTGKWHTRSEAISMVQARAPNGSGPLVAKAAGS